jgi:hypothetical protein
MIEPGLKEKKAISALNRLQKIWPDTLWIFATGNSLSIMKKDESGNHAITRFGGIDPEYEIDSVDIENDGGDW